MSYETEDIILRDRAESDSLSDYKMIQTDIMETVFLLFITLLPLFNKQMKWKSNWSHDQSL